MVKQMVCYKVYKTISYKFSIKNSESLKIYSINIHLTNNSLTISKCHISKILYMIVTHCLNKILYNKVFFGTNFTYLFKCWHIHTIHANFKNANLGTFYYGIHNCTILHSVRYSCKHFNPKNKQIIQFCLQTWYYSGEIWAITSKAN